MVSLWVIIGLIVSAASISILGAGFSVIGIGALFSGAAIAVSLMAGSLELGKFVLAAYLHQRWQTINFLMKVYLTISVVVLSGITSLGIFGFLSEAYQSSARLLDKEKLVQDSLMVQKQSALNEIERLTKSIDEIPMTRVSRKLQARKEAEPAFAAYREQIDEIDKKISESNMRLHDVKQKVGPLMYISRAFNLEIDQVVKYLIWVFVLVFDPLAICLVIATSEAIQSRQKKQYSNAIGNDINANKHEVAARSESKPPAEEPVVQMFFSEEDEQEPSTSPEDPQKTSDGQQKNAG